jgi:uncharacterized protein (DUF697 family)
MLSLNQLYQEVGRSITRLGKTVLSPEVSAMPEEEVTGRARAVAPVIWLLGKVQSGKSSIVRGLTGRAEAEVGSGFRACTATSYVFDFPEEAPVVRFLDTRGLGEAGYDPTDDLAMCEGQAHVILVVLRALDHEQAAVHDVVRAARRRHPEWPVLVVQTCLHEAYDLGTDHPESYAFSAQGAPLEGGRCPPALQRSLAIQRRMFGDLPGFGRVRFVPIDFTREDDGFEPVLYGMEALIDALRDVLPEVVVASLNPNNAGHDFLAQRSHPHIVGYATVAAASDLVPVGGAVAVPGVQAKMLHSLARIYGITWDRKSVAQFVAALGLGTATRTVAIFAIREVAKLIPAYGQTAGAAAAASASFATTYALGKAACAFLRRRRWGAVERGAVSAVYREALSEALRLRSRRRAQAGG